MLLGGHNRRLSVFLQMFMDLVLEGLLREHLMVAPLLVIVGITEQLVTMGAEDFKVINALDFIRHYKTATLL